MTDVNGWTVERRDGFTWTTEDGGTVEEPAVVVLTRGDVTHLLSPNYTDEEIAAYVAELNAET